MFSRRAAWELNPNPLTRLLEEKRRSGEAIVDLTVSNPTACGLPGNREWTVSAAPYAPRAQGQHAAREAVAAYYAAQGLTIHPEQVVLTASTSESYALILKLLGNPEDRVLIPKPGYPLFDDLVRLEGLHPQPYAAGQIAAIRGGLEGGAVALFIVSPDNPTGAVIDGSLRTQIVDLCRRHQIPLVADEVFLDYPAEDSKRAISSHASVSEALCFTLSGLSKVCGLPGLKLGWIVVTGPDALRREALARLEVIADTYLSVNQMAQQALPELLDQRHVFQSAVRRRLGNNRDHLAKTFGAMQSAGGGWAAVLTLPEGQQDEAFALALLHEKSTRVHPGYLFDFPQEDRIVLSLLTPEQTFALGCDIVQKQLALRRSSQ